MKHFWFRVLLLSAIILPLFARGGENFSLLCSGQAEIEEGNFARARAEALSQAFRQAVNSALLKELPPQLLEENSELIEEKFLSEPEPFVYRYRIISEQVSGNLYLMEAEVEVSLPNLRNHLIQTGLIISPERSLLLMVLEKQDSSFTSAWLKDSAQANHLEKLLSLELKRWGFRVVSPEPIFQLPELEENLTLSGWLSQLGRKYQARFLIYATARVEAQESEIIKQKEEPEEAEEKPKKIYQFSAQLELKIFDLEKEEAVFQCQRTEKVTGFDYQSTRYRLMERLVNSLLGDLSLTLERLSQRSELPAEKSRSEIISILGLSSWYQYQQITEGLKKIAQIQNFQLFEFTPGEVRLKINYQGKTGDLIRAITSYQFPDLRLLPLESSERKFTFRIQPRF